MLDTILEESNNTDIAVVWAINAKNSLTNVHGFSPYQLAIGQNHILSCAATSKPLVLTHTPTSKILEENLRYLHKSRQAIIHLNKVRTYNDTCFLTGDSVYFKRAHEKQWRGPSKVLGQDGKQVLIKYGANYVWVHPCRITLDRNPTATTKQQSKDNTETDNENESSSSKINQTDSNSDSDSDNFDSTHSNCLDNQIQSHNSTDNMIHNNTQHITATETQEPANSLQKDKII